MQRPLREHIVYIEQKIETLKAKLENDQLPASEREAVVMDLGIAERALLLFRKAFELEQKLSV